ncbi:MAG: dihydrodipicolinate reductase [Bifidobacteriaceae bacterium]|jgi:4-hydroxy-tetrahydrodipicolinate reductase|nr:dihydrodipicolinate reductase [Bifidobacteriaceae bacterium]
MSSQPTKVVLYGSGLMGTVIIRYLVEKGFDLVGVIDNNPDLIGKDAGQLAGLGRDLGVTVSADADEVLSRGADVAILTLLSLMSDMEPFFAACARHGVNAISTCEEAFYPRTTSPEITARLDALAKEHGVTLTGSGYQDVYWGNLATVIAGSTQRIDAMEGFSSYNVDDYGIALAQVHGVGLTAEEFQREIADANVPSFAMNVPGWIASQMGLDMIDISQELMPEFVDTPLESSTLGRAILPGQAAGMTAKATAHTRQGIDIVMKVQGKVYRPDEVDLGDWVIRGEPTTRVNVAEPKTVELTCATIVNRLPQVIAAAPGFTTLEKLRPAPYLPTVAQQV